MDRPSRQSGRQQRPGRKSRTEVGERFQCEYQAEGRLGNSKDGFANRTQEKEYGNSSSREGRRERGNRQVGAALFEREAGVYQHRRILLEETGKKRTFRTR